jgi:hypothetical protein
VIAPAQQIAAAASAQEPSVPPWSLTASDGSGLVMTRVDAKAVFEGPLAFTELHLWFHNSENRRREGTFQITLPARAAVSRFAMETDGRWMEAEVVEKQLARRAYDDFLHRRQDPALLEKAEGNQFTAKVFPIPAKGDKHIVISFSQELPGVRYVLPLHGLPTIERVDVSLDETTPDGKHQVETLHRNNWQPDHDFVSQGQVAAAAITNGSLVALQLAPFAGQAQDSDKPAGLTLLVDTSASRGLGYATYLRNLQELVARLRVHYGDALRLQVVAFDQDSEDIFRGAAKDFGDAAGRKLLERGAAGASDLGQALTSLVQPEARVVVVTDGVITAGADRVDLEAMTKKLAQRKVDRVDVVLAGGLRDAEVAGALVHAGLPHAGAVLDLDGGVEDVAIALGQPVLVDVPVAITGADWVYPKTIPTIRPGANAIVYARLAKPNQVLDVNIGGEREQVALTAASDPLVERAVASAEIEELEHRLPGLAGKDAQALRADIAKRSIAARVVSSQTSMLVLESDDDYARYGIDRNALTDILAIGSSGVEVLHRTAIAKSDPPKGRQTNDGDLDLPVDEAKNAERKQIARNDSTRQLEGGAPEQGAIRVTSSPTTATTVFLADSGKEVPSDTKSVEPPPAPVPLPAVTSRPPPAPSFEPRPAVGSAHSGYDGAGQGRMVSREPSVGDPYGGHDDYDQSAERAPWPPADKPIALVGELAAIEGALRKHDLGAALAKASAWHAREPGDVRALIGLGDVLEAKADYRAAARTYGSIIDLFPGRADMRRFAGERLARVAAHFDPASSLIVDTYRRAVADRPDHLTGHRLLAYALLRAGKPADAFAAILAGIDQRYPEGRFAGGERVLGDDASMIGAAYAAAEPSRRKEIVTELHKRHVELATRPSTRFILYWETDGNDVDFHIQDALGNHAWYGHLPLASGGELYADITTGYGPECFAIQGTPKAGPYKLSIDYYSQGPMGYGMGLLEIQRFDGKGTLKFEDRPYVIMNDHAYVDLGTWK